MQITYYDDNLTIPVREAGSTILAVSVANKVPHFRECGGQARCTTCRVRVLDGVQHVSERTAREARIAAQRGWDPYTRLACQARVSGDVTVRRLVRTAADISLLQAEVLSAEPGREMPVAILICDIRRFTPFADANLPHDVCHILNRFYGELGEPILLNGGLIYQYVGDQIVGLFGLRGEAPEQSCLSAVRAGLGMVEALQSLNTVLESEFGVRLDIRIGAHVGPLVVGFMGHPAWMQFGVVGDAINTASRVENANEPLGTTFLISEALHRHLDVPIREGQRTNVLLKGKGGFHTLVEVKGFADPDVDLIVQRTAKQLLGDQDRFGEVFYRRLFETAPAARAMFTGDVEAQGRMLTQVLQAAVYGLSRFGEVARGLAAIGRSHAGYGVTAVHYHVFGQVFMETVAEVLGNAFDAEVEAAWKEIVARLLDAVQGKRNTAVTTSDLETA